MVAFTYAYNSNIIIFLTSSQKEQDQIDASGNWPGSDVVAHRLEEIYKRLTFIDADTAEARAASILAVSS